MVTTRSQDESAHQAATAGEKRPAAESQHDDASPKRHKASSSSSGAHKEEPAPAHHHRHHEKKVVQMPPGVESDEEDKGKDKDKDKGKGGATSPATAKKEEETPAPPPPQESSSSTAAKKEEEEGGGEAVEGNAEEGQVPKHEPNPDPERKHGEPGSNDSRWMHTDDVSGLIWYAGILERGFIYFLFRPKVEVDHPESLDDVSKFHILLVPYGTKFHRLIAVGKKALPEASESTRPIWGEVLNVGEDLKALKDGLGAYTYETKTMGEFDWSIF